MSRFSCLVLLLFSLAGCGGENETILNASLAVPLDLIRFSPYEAALTLADPSGETILWGPTPLDWNEETELWEADLSDMDKADYLATVEIITTLFGAPLVLAEASDLLSLPKGTGYATLTFKPSDFDTSMDDDGDDISNLSESVGSL